MTKYDSLPLQSKRTWERMGWAQQEGGDIQQRLADAIGAFQAFYDGLSQNPQVQITKALEEIAKEIRNGRADATSVVTLGTSDSSNSDFDNEDSGWAQVVRDLQDLGVSEAMAAENRTFIVDWIMRAINLGWLDEKVPATETTTPMMSTPSPILPQPVSQPEAFSRLPEHLSPQSPWLPGRISAHEFVAEHDTQEASGLVDDTPPSPIEPEEPETNLVWTAQKIVHFWNQKEWSKARECLEEQLEAVRRGQTIVMGGATVAPDQRILQHLIGVSYSYEGNFPRAKDVFQAVLQGVSVPGMPLDDGDIAAARWLGETCIHLTEIYNACLAWAIALCGASNKFDLREMPLRFIADLRLLNQQTSGLYSLKNAFIRSNRDSTTILGGMAGPQKFQVVEAALEHLTNFAHVNSTYGVGNLAYRRAQSTSIAIAEGFLVQPLVSQASWPLPQDPFFRPQNAISLLASLSRPKMLFPFDQIPTVGGLGQSKGLIYTTKNSAQWLVDTVRLALSTYAIEWKISGPMFLCRLSHSYQHIAYYECYGVKLRKLPLRNIYGIKITEKLFSTRGFVPSLTLANGEEEEQGMPNGEEAKRRLVVKTELGDRLRDFLTEAEKALAEGRKFPPDFYFPPKGPFELGSTIHRGAELEDSGVAELSAGRERQELAVPEVFELPAERYP